MAPFFRIVSWFLRTCCAIFKNYILVPIFGFVSWFLQTWYDVLGLYLDFYLLGANFCDYFLVSTNLVRMVEAHAGSLLDGAHTPQFPWNHSHCNILPGSRLSQIWTLLGGENLCIGGNGVAVKIARTISIFWTNCSFLKSNCYSFPVHFHVCQK